VDLAAPVHEAGASAVAAGTLFVFQGPGRGVLINYPPRRQIEKILNAVDRPPMDGQRSA
jgi:cyclase